MCVYMLVGLLFVFCTDRASRVSLVWGVSMGGARTSPFFPSSSSSCCCVLFVSDFVSVGHDGLVVVVCAF